MSRRLNLYGHSSRTTHKDLMAGGYLYRPGLAGALTRSRFSNVLGSNPADYPRVTLIGCLSEHALETLS